MQHNFDVFVAEQYGVNEAIFLNNMAYWIHKNMANEKHYHEGRHWTYNSVDAFKELFRYWSTRTLRTVIQSCIKNKLILTGNFNKQGYDRTTWYALTDKALELFPWVKKPVEPASDLICQKRQMDLSKTTNGFVKNDKPIPNKKPNKKQIKKTVTDVSLKPEKRKAKDQKQKKEIEPNFYPNYQNQQLADHVAMKCNTSGAWLIKRFIDITLDSGRKEYDFNDLFARFLEKQRPVNERRDFKGASQISKYI